MARPRKAGVPVDVLGRDWITRSTARASAKLDRDRAGLKRLRRHGFKAAALDESVLREHNRHYTSVLPFGEVANQEQSGNCWLFAPLVLVRAAALQKGSISAKVSFSETYLYFFDLLEKARAALFRVHRMTARREPLAGDTLRQGLKHEVMGLADGGEWEWAFNLIEKYGLVPSALMPATASANDTDALRVDLHERLARATRAIQRMPENTPPFAIRRCTTWCISWWLTWAARPRPCGCAGAGYRPPSIPSRSSVSARPSGGW